MSEHASRRTEPLRGRRADRTPRPSEQYPVGRVCAIEGCTTILSRYNPELTCWPHTNPAATVRVSPDLEHRENRNETVRSMWRAGSTLREIAEELGISRTRVHQIIRAGLEHGRGRAA